MWSKLFGRKDEVSKAAPNRQTVDAGEFPWKHSEDETACNLAYGHLVHNLMERCADENGIHAETCVAAFGAVAGFAAQRALFARMAADRDDPARNEMRLVTTAMGGRFIFGEPLNQMFFAHDDRELHRLWPLAAGAAVAAGVADPPEPTEFFAHVSRALGSEAEGWPSTPAPHRPHLACVPLLKAAWPIAKPCLTGELSGLPAELGTAPRSFWPAITAHAAGTALRKTATVLDPRIGLTILMESAIYASKVDPVFVDPSETPIDADQALPSFSPK
jgi:hypothetical protein